MSKFFFDTYALFEIVHGKESYLPYNNSVIVVTKLNLMELHYRLLDLYGKQYANKAYNKFLPFVVDITDDMIKRANELKLFYKKKRLSYVDCIGYIVARFNDMKFLTGDKEFEHFDNVEFVK